MVRTFDNGHGWKEGLMPVDIYMHKGNNRNTRTKCEISLKLTIKIPERRHVGVSFFMLTFVCQLFCKKKFINSSSIYLKPPCTYSMPVYP